TRRSRRSASRSAFAASDRSVPRSPNWSASLQAITPVAAAIYEPGSPAASPSCTHDQSNRAVLEKRGPCAEAIVACLSDKERQANDHKPLPYHDLGSRPGGGPRLLHPAARLRGQYG